MKKDKLSGFLVINGKIYLESPLGKEKREDQKDMEKVKECGEGRGRWRTALVWCLPVRGLYLGKYFKVLGSHDRNYSTAKCILTYWW